MLLNDIPEVAISAFEQTHGVWVTVHDLEGTLAPFLKRTRFYHRAPVCLAVKASGLSDKCVAFETEPLRRALASQPEGRSHVCHALLREWVVPVMNRGRLAWVLFAGPRAMPHRKQKWGPSPGVKTLEGNEVDFMLELLRQLAARLSVWAHTAPAVKAVSVAPTRRWVIEQFVEENLGNKLPLLALARRLGLSEGRTTHLVREIFAMSFRELLIEKRIGRAVGLLTQQKISLIDIAEACGFESLRHFHRSFLSKMGTTPGRFRKEGPS